MPEEQLYPYGKNTEKSLTDYFLAGVERVAAGEEISPQLRKDLLSATALTPNSPYAQHLQQRYEQQNTLDTTALHYYRAGVAVGEKLFNKQIGPLEKAKYSSPPDSAYPEVEGAVEQACQKLPKHIQILLGLGGTKIYLGRRLEEVFPQYVAKEGRGYNKNRTLAFAPAFFIPQWKQIHIWQQHQSQFLKDEPYIVSRAAYASVLHECGHAVSKAIAGGSLHTSLLFTKAYLKDIEALKTIPFGPEKASSLTLNFTLADTGEPASAQWQGEEFATATGRRKQLAYYLEITEGGRQADLYSATDEAFAELFKATTLNQETRGCLLDTFKHAAAARKQISEAIAFEMQQPVAVDKFLPKALP